MSDAPERIWAEDSNTDWSQDNGVWGVDKENSHDVEYIRADLHDLQTRIAELEAKLTTAKNALMRISQGGSGVLLTSYPPQDPDVNLAKRILAELEGGTG